MSNLRLVPLTASSVLLQSLSNYRLLLLQDNITPFPLFRLNRPVRASYPESAYSRNSQLSEHTHKHTSDMVRHG